MIFFNLLYFLIISLSFSVMWSFSDIFSPFRNLISRVPYLRRALLCPECSSFWVGLMCSFFIYNPIEIKFDFFIISNIICGLVTHLFAFLLYAKNEKKNIKFI